MSLISRLYRLFTGEPAVIKSTGAGTQADPAIPHVIIESTIEVADWDNITNKPATYPPDTHGHDASEITGLDTLTGGASDWATITNKPLTFPPDTHEHSWGAIADKPLVFPPDTHEHSWGAIADKPLVFPPDAHEHSWGAIADKPTTFPPDTHGHDWAEITSKPATYPPDTHGHDASEITGLDTLTGGASDWSEITNKPLVFPPDTHGHGWAEITSKPATYPPDTHTHTASDITGLSTGKIIAHYFYLSDTSVAIPANTTDYATDLSLTITPKSASSFLLIFADICWGGDGTASRFELALRKGSANLIRFLRTSPSSRIEYLPINFRELAGDTNSRTYGIVISTITNIGYFNYAATNIYTFSSLTILEVAPND